MKHKLSSLTLSLVISLPALLPAAAMAAEDKFTLARAVPADVFLCVSGRHNAERAFVDEYWGEVFTAAKECGIGDDIMGMITDLLGEGEGLNEVNRLKDRARELLDGVDWSALVGGEMVFAERMSAIRNKGKGNSNMGPPDLLWVFRGEQAQKNYAGLVKMLEAAVAEISKATGAEGLVVVQDERHGAKVSHIDLLAAEHHGMSFGVAVAQRDDLVIITVGDRILDETLALLAGASKASLVATERYQSAFAQLPAAEDSKVFFDVQRLMAPFSKLLALAAKEEGGVDDVIRNAQDSGEAFDLNAQAVQAYRDKDHARALELVKQAAKVDPNDSRICYNVACFSALNGERDAALAALTQAVDRGFYAPVLIAKDGDLESLRDAPEFKQALAKATEQAQAQGGNKGEIIRRVGERLLGIPGMFDYVASVEYTEGYSLHSKSVAALVPGAQKQPFYRVITGKPEMTSFDKYLPEETKSFSVSGGFDIRAFYTFVEDTFKAAGSEGEAAWGMWQKWQEEVGFDVHKNVLGWMGGDFVTVTLDDNRGSVFMMKVKDDAVAREKVGAAVEFLSTKLVEAASENPMLAMMAVRTSPVQHEKLEGFENLFIGMSPQPVVWGVANGHLIFADKADAIVTCLETAEGKHAGVRKNARVMEEALVPEGDFVAVSLTDQRMLGQELAAGIGMFSMMSGMMTMVIPDKNARQIIGKVSGILMKLTPVVSKIDFYKSIASHTTFDGKAWHTHAVTHYAKPAERTANAG